MPHLRVEFAPGLIDAMVISKLCERLHAVLVATGVFPVAGIRIKALACDEVRVADLHPENGFVALELSVGAGRSRETLAAVGEALFEAAREVLRPLLDRPHFALSLEIREIDARLSWKDNPMHARISREAAR